MKYFCYINLKRNPFREEAIKLMYPRIKVISGLYDLFSITKPSDTVVFDSVLELDPTGDNLIPTIIRHYKLLTDKNIDIIFDRSPSCDSKIVSNYLDRFKDKGFSFEDERTAIDALLEMQIESYINFKDASANFKKYSQLSANKSHGKAYGRPVGIRRDSVKAIKAKAIILLESKDFNGTLSDEECIPLSGASRNMFYKYKKQLKEKGVQ